MERWTNREESELQRLMKRKIELTAKNMAPLVELVKREVEPERCAENIAEALAANADDFRDALEPFDSGIRAAPPNAA